MTTRIAFGLSLLAAGVCFSLQPARANAVEHKTLEDSLTDEALPSGAKVKALTLRVIGTVPGVASAAYPDRGLCAEIEGYIRTVAGKQLQQYCGGRIQGPQVLEACHLGNSGRYMGGIFVADSKYGFVKHKFVCLDSQGSRR